MRGRLIYPFGIEIYRLDTKGTATSPGYNATFREANLIPTDDGLGQPGRQELDPLIVPGQFTHLSDFQRLQMSNNGNLAESACKVIFAFSDLEDMGLIETSTGTAMIRVGDRLSAVFGPDDTLVQAYPNPPGMFCIQAEPRMGLGMSRNLLVTTFMSRDQGMAGASTFGSGGAGGHSGASGGGF